MNGASSTSELSQPMTAFLLQPRRQLLVWLAAFVSPTGYCLLLMLADRLGLAAPPESVVAAMFFGLPLVALAVCGWAVWSVNLSTGRKVVWLVFTVLGIALQCGAILALIIAVTAAISLP